MDSSADEAEDYQFNRLVREKGEYAKAKELVIAAECGRRSTKVARMKAALNQAELRQQKRANLSDSQRQHLNLRDSYDAAIRKARGEKVFDNVTKLKRSLQNRAKQSNRARTKKRSAAGDGSAEARKGKVATVRTSEIPEPRKQTRRERAHAKRQQRRMQHLKGLRVQSKLDERG